MSTDELAPLRITAFLAACCGLLALVTAHLLSPAAAFAAGAVTAAASLSCSSYRSAGARVARRRLGLGALALALAYVALHIAQTSDVQRLAQTLPPLLIGVLAAQSLSADKRHDLVVLVTVGEFMLVLAAGIAPSPWLAAPLLAGWVLAVVTLVQSHDLHDTDCSTPALAAPVRARRQVAGPAATATALALAIGLLLFLVLPHPSSSAAQRRLLGGQAAGNRLASEGNGTGTRRLSDGVLDMRTRGKLPTGPVAEVSDDSPELWRNRIYDTYDGTIWTASPSEVTALGRGVVQLPPDELDEGVPPAEQIRTDTVRRFQYYADDLVIAPGTPLVVRSDGRVWRAGAAMVRTESRSGFVVTSALPETDPGVLAGAEGPDPGPRWLQLPASLPARVGALAHQIAGNAPSRPAAVASVSAYLAEHKRYSLDSPVPPAGADAVDDFLFRVDSGFCEHFAAAEVVLLRSLGIPARMATGYGYGESQPGGLRLFRGSNAHAWVEVFYPGIGWSPSDPTPPAVQTAGQNRPGVFARFVKWVKKELSTTRGRLILAAVIAAAVAAGCGIGWLRRRRTPRGSAPAPAILTTSLLTAFGRLEAALAADGRPRAPAETLAELQRRLGADADGRLALATLELACYSPHLVTPADAKAAAHTFEQLAASVLAARAARERLAGSIGVRR
jgi:transglutaminase-like putative cysteine protease